VTTLSALLALINIGNNAAFNGTISLVLEGFYISYLLAIGLLLWRRFRGDMDDPNSGLTAFTSNAHADETFDRRMGPLAAEGVVGHGQQRRGMLLSPPADLLQLLAEQFPHRRPSADELGGGGDGGCGLFQRGVLPAVREEELFGTQGGD
jgi:hypothetical protein